MILKKKRVGTVLPMTALICKTAKPGTFAAGKIFIDWLAKSKQTAWQLLPLHQQLAVQNLMTSGSPSADAYLRLQN